jgi:hypothetical protein
MEQMLRCRLSIGGKGKLGHIASQVLAIHTDTSLINLVFLHSADHAFDILAEFTMIYMCFTQRS